MGKDDNLYFRTAYSITGLSDLQQMVEDQESRMELLGFQISNLTLQPAIKTYLRVQKEYISADGKVFGPSGIAVQAEA